MDSPVEKYYNEWSKSNINWPYNFGHLLDFASYVIECENKKHEELDKASSDAWWAEVHVILLVNFLRMPEENQRSFLESIIERKPTLFQSIQNEYEQRKP